MLGVILFVGLIYFVTKSVTMTLLILLILALFGLI